MPIVAAAFVLQMLAVCLPAAQPFFHTLALSAQGLAIGFAASALVLVATDLEKLIRHRVVGEGRSFEDGRAVAAGGRK